jgi:sulfatase modifying factor 1
MYQCFMKAGWYFPVTFMVSCAMVVLTASCSTLRTLTTTETHCHGSSLVMVPAGWFLMGEDDGNLANQPKHRVYLDAYCIQLTEVIRQDFAAFIIATEYIAPGWLGQPDIAEQKLPVAGVRWRDADAYCQWKGMRLPSEAEWEKAARGIDGRRYPWGDKWDNQKSNTLQSGQGYLTSVGSFPKGASPFGLMDMAGNAAEWVADFFDPAYYLSSPDHNPLGPSIILDHGLRGGSFASPPEQSTTYFRDSSHSVKPNPRVGFRCAISLPR